MSEAWIFLSPFRPSCLFSLPPPLLHGRRGADPALRPSVLPSIVLGQTVSSILWSGRVLHVCSLGLLASSLDHVPQEAPSSSSFALLHICSPHEKTIFQTNLPGHPPIYSSVNKAEASMYMHQTWTRAEIQTSSQGLHLWSCSLGKKPGSEQVCTHTRTRTHIQCDSHDRCHARSAERIVGCRQVKVRSLQMKKSMKMKCLGSSLRG